MKHLNLIFYAFLLLAVLSACGNTQSENPVSYQPSFTADTTKSNTLIFGFPSFSYSEIAAPFIKHLNDHLKGTRIKMKACTSYEEYLDDLKHHRYDFTLINGIEALHAENNGYTIFGKVMDDTEYSGVIFVNKKAGINRVKELSNKTIALAPYQSTMMALYYLFQQGVDVNKDIVLLDVSSFESAIIATYTGKSDAGVCLKRNWDVYVKTHPEILEKVELKWKSPPLINNALLFNNTTDPQTKTLLSSLLFSMHHTIEGKKALTDLQFTGFEKATNITYKPMLDFKAKYDSVIHLKKRI